MTLIDQSRIAAARALKATHFPFQRAKEINTALSWCINDYYVKAEAGRPFEARGVLVTGLSRNGKTHELERAIAGFHDRQEMMPDGRPARIVHCLLSRSVSWKELGRKTAEAMGYRMLNPRNAGYAWDMVLHQARGQGIIGIHYDEAQHVFGETTDITNERFLDDFKTLLKDRRWPLMLILSGVPSLAHHVHKYEQLDELLEPVKLESIDLSKREDLTELINLTYSYAAAAEVDIEPIVTQDFLHRLSHAAAHRWGIVIELLIEALILCKLSGTRSCTIDHFVQAFAQRTKIPHGYSPFTVDDYETCVEPAKLKKLMQISD